MALNILRAENESFSSLLLSNGQKSCLLRLIINRSSFSPSFFFLCCHPKISLPACHTISLQIGRLLWFLILVFFFFFSLIIYIIPFFFFFLIITIIFFLSILLSQIYKLSDIIESIHLMISNPCWPHIDKFETPYRWVWLF